MTKAEETVYTLTEETAYKASELMETLEYIRYDPIGASAEDAKLMQEINKLLQQAMEKAGTVERHVGKGRNNN